MVRPLIVSIALEGAMYDAQRAIHENDCRRAYLILRKKLHEIEVQDTAEWGNVHW